MAIVTTDDTHYKNIAETIRSWAGLDETYRPEDMWNGVEQVYWAGYRNGRTDGEETGKQAEYDRFWDAFQQNGERNYYRYGFTGYGWNSDNFKPKYDIILTSTWATYLFCDTINLNIDLAQRMQELGVSFVYSNFTNAAEMFKKSAITRIGELDFSKVTETYRAFSEMPNLETVDKLIVSEVTKYGSPFYNCPALKILIIDGWIANALSFQWSPLLINASIQSIIDHLKDLTGVDTQTITFHADVGAKLTDEQKATISAKNWTLAY